MKYEFSWQVTSVHLETRTLQVEYTRLDTGKKYIVNMNQPTDVDLNTHIQNRAPFKLWNNELLPIISESIVGLAGTNTVIPTLENSKKNKLIEIANFRYAKEIEGITVDGVNISTTRESRTSIESTFANLSNGFVTSVDFKTKDGTFNTFGLSEMTAIASAVAIHVQMCFTEEKNYIDQLNLATTIDEVDLIVLS